MPLWAFRRQPARAPALSYYSAVGIERDAQDGHRLRPGRCGSGTPPAAAQRNLGAGVVVGRCGGHVVSPSHYVIAVQPALRDPLPVLERAAVYGGCGGDVGARDVVGRHLERV